MDQVITVPQAGEAIRSVVVTKFRKSIGERVVCDEIIVVLETNKASLDIESPVEGIVKAFLRKEGEVVAVGEPLIVISVANAESLSASDEIIVKEGNLQPLNTMRTPIRNGQMSPRQKKMYYDNVVSLGTARINNAINSVEPEHASSEGAYDRHVLPSSQLQLNRAMAASAREIVPANLQTLCDNAPIENFRRKLRQANRKFIPSRLELIAWATVQALKIHPRFGSRLVDVGILRQYQNPNLGIAIALPDDQLTTAVVEGIFTNNFVQFVEKMRQGVARAKTKPTLPAPHSITISDLSTFGMTGAIPVVVAPAVATLFIGTPYFNEGSKRYFQLSLSFDHRINNGAGGASFLKEICSHLREKQLGLGLENQLEHSA